MSVPTATFALNPKSRIRIGVIRLPPPIPVIPTRIPTPSPASENCQVTARGGSGQETNGRPLGGSELVGLAAGAEAGARREQREHGDEEPEPRSRPRSAP